MIVCLYIYVYCDNSPSSGRESFNVAALRLPPPPVAAGTPAGLGGGTPGGGRLIFPPSTSLLNVPEACPVGVTDEQASERRRAAH